MCIAFFHDIVAKYPIDYGTTGCCMSYGENLKLEVASEASQLKTYINLKEQSKLAKSI